MSAVRRFLDLSNAHLSDEDRACLDAWAGHDAGEVFCARTPYGWFVYACEERPAISDTLWALMLEARRRGCEHLLFDRDAPTIDGWPVFEWEDGAFAPARGEEREPARGG